MNARAQAGKLLKRVIVEDLSWEPHMASGEEAPLIRHYCFSVLRYYDYLQAVLDQLVKKPLKPKDEDIKAILFIAIFELWQKSKKSYAVVNESVHAASHLRKAWAKGMINATLRTFLRQEGNILAKLSPDAESTHPAWLTQAFQKAWPEQCQDILRMNQQHPVMTLRINPAKTSRDAYLQILNEQGMPAHPLPYSDQAITLEKPLDVFALPGFNEGVVSVQDLSAQLAALLLNLKPELKVLDACSAPGGKCAHMLEREPSLDMMAVEVNPKRVTKLNQTLNRLALKANVRQQDAMTLGDDLRFDRILLDAPCSGTGVIRRHPDIKRHLTPEKIKHAVEHQRALLDHLWTLLKPEGLLLYATCSIMPEENHLQIAQFLQRHSDAQVQAIQADWGIELATGRQILPQDHMDGFYYALLIKR